jgi:hypothetical protein
MKSTITFLPAAFTVLTGMALLVACKKEPEIYQPENRDFSNKAFVKVYNSVVNSSRNYIYVDDVPVNSAAALIYATRPLFPSVSYYAAIDAGSRALVIRDTLVTSTQKPIAFTADFAAGGNYTIFTYDTLTNAKHLVVKDIIQSPTDTSSRLRLASLVYSRNPVPNVDIYSLKLRTNIFTNVSFGAVTDYVSYQSGQADTLFVRTAGTSTNLAQLNNFNPTAKRSYTIVFRGNYPSTTGSLARSLTQFVDY